MFSWVVKIVPQPPEPPRELKKDETDKEESSPKPTPTPAPVPQAPPVTKQVEAKEKVQPKTNVAVVPETKKPTEGSSETTEAQAEDKYTQGGILSWVTQGFDSILPKPSESPRNSRANATEEKNEDIQAKESSRALESSRNPADEQGGGVLSWITEGLSKVVPQPESKYKPFQSSTEDKNIEEAKVEPQLPPQTEESPPDIKIIEVVSVASQESEIDNTAIQPSSPTAASVISWIKQGLEKVVPQPADSPVVSNKESHQKQTVVEMDEIKKVAVSTEKEGTKEKPIPAKVPEPAEPIQHAEEASQPVSSNLELPGVVGWFVQGFGKVIPQPVTRNRSHELEEKAEASSCQVQQRGKAMVTSETKGR